MSERERTLKLLTNVLNQVARPYLCDEAIPVDVRAALWQLGVPCSELTPRDVLVSRLWARKRNLMAVHQPSWGGPTAPSAA